MSAASAPLNRVLTADEQRRLEAAHAALRQAVLAYAQFRGQPLCDSNAVEHDAVEMARAQAGIETAEAHLWQVREDLLGWARPSSTPRASLIADWFSEDDAVYDALGDDVERIQS